MRNPIVKLIIHKSQTDSRDVTFDVDGKERGFGYIGYDNGVALIKCPLCGKENYAFNVSSGICTWCPFETSQVTT